ncbi:PorT family protein [Cellulophaga baltica]|jgi:hypothetical protein|uniref:porin family protein n=1 Tax=Cellulophaga TaxID=104264 RepID=UPI001C0698E2|nr:MULTISPECIES: porin family protein [Cellulophaga]MBU2996275.1 PorT family protein [Cellulophaga baltica]MDO6767670.1 porin family protein [Cellulophaga sp. 1_MG-2023]
MKTKLIIILTLILNTYSYAQITFEKGYFINNANEKVDCLIKNIDWRKNPIEFDYKLTDQSDIKRATIGTVKEFGINNSSKYIRSKLKIDRSSSDVNKLSTDKNPIFSEEQLFLKVLIEGKSSLYEYIDSSIKRFFFSSENSNIEQLVFKSYVTSTGNYYGENNTFRQQLLNNLKCPKFTEKRFKNLSYKKKELLKLFIENNNCFEEESSNFEKTKNKDLFNLSIRPRLVNSSLLIDTFSDLRDIDFGNKTNLSLGLEAEFILSFNKNKWSVIIEPTYQNFKAEKTKEVSDSFGGELNNKVDYSSIEIPVGIRYYMFLNNKSKFFANISLVTDFDFNSSIDYERGDGFDLESLDIKSKINSAFGLGYKYDDKYILELRYQTKRDVLSDYPSDVSNYNSFSLIIGYTLF